MRKKRLMQNFESAKNANMRKTQNCKKKKVPRLKICQIDEKTHKLRNVKKLRMRKKRKIRNSEKIAKNPGKRKNAKNGKQRN